MSTRQTIKSIIEREWDQFQHTNNEGGRASCQGNRPMFEVMRASQFAAWPQELLTSYVDGARDLRARSGTASAAIIRGAHRAAGTHHQATARMGA